MPERATRPIPKRRPLYVTANYKADPEKKASVRDSYKADPEKKASVRDSYKADPEKKKASVRDSYKADPEKKKASVRSLVPRPRFPTAAGGLHHRNPPAAVGNLGLGTRLLCTRNADIESKQSAKRQRYQEDVEENRAVVASQAGA
eukprot:Em0001g3783a